MQRRNGTWTWYYHAVITNKCPKAPAKNCRVTMRRMQRRTANGSFADLRIPTALQFQWSHPDVTPPTPEVTSDRTLDLGFVDENTDRVHPALYSYPNNFDGAVMSGQCLRYHLDIEADNFVSKKSTIIEITWNGEWSRDRDEMSENVTVCEVSGD